MRRQTARLRKPSSFARDFRPTRISLQLTAVVAWAAPASRRPAHVVLPTFASQLLWQRRRQYRREFSPIKSSGEVGLEPTVPMYSRPAFAASGFGTRLQTCAPTRNAETRGDLTGHVVPTAFGAEKQGRRLEDEG